MAQTPASLSPLILLPSILWAKSTRFKPKLSGETNGNDSDQIVAVPKPKEAKPSPKVDLESDGASPLLAVNGEPKIEKMLVLADRDQLFKKMRETKEIARNATAAGTNGQARFDPPPHPPKPSQDEKVVDILPQSIDDEEFVVRHSHMKYELRGTPDLSEL